MNRKTLFIVAASCLLLAFVGAALIFNTEQVSTGQARATANSEALIRMHSPSLGRSDAPVVIVEFLDPACETCAAFYPLIKEMMAANRDQIRLVLRYAPFHQGSDQVVAALEAARKQGQFWPALEKLLSVQDDWTYRHTVQVDRIWPHLQQLGLDMQQLQSDMAAPEIMTRITQDLRDAETLNVSKTPEFFVNGKSLPRFGYEPLKALVDQALAASRK